MYFAVNIIVYFSLLLPRPFTNVCLAFASACSGEFLRESLSLCRNLAVRNHFLLMGVENHAYAAFNLQVFILHVHCSFCLTVYTCVLVDPVSPSLSRQKYEIFLT